VSPSRVVVVDDEREVCDLVGRVLQRAGHEVVTAQTGDQGLALVAEGGVACLVVDKLMPGLGGLEVMAEVRRRWPTLPIVLMTGHPEPFQLGDARPQVVLAKPFANLQAIADAVASAVDAAGARTDGPLSQLRDRMVAVVNEIAPVLKKRDPE
jgi:CheY-like chemotaxis protein